MDLLNRGDRNRPIKFECYDYDKGAKDDFIGECILSFNEIEAAAGAPQPLVDSRKAKKRSVGELVIEAATTPRPSFLSYIASKFTIDMAIFIDYTASNQPHTDRNSLHFLSAKHMNAYQRVLDAVAGIMLPYTSYTYTFGFGAKVLPTKKTSHCFSLDVDNPSGLLAENSLECLQSTYVQSLDNVILHGPTYFAPLLQKVMELAQASHQDETSHKYLFCVIITDGELDDQSATCKLLSQLCVFPVSIVIVGVGSAPFNSMYTLDDDEGELGIIRDIVQFVPFAKVDPENLAEEMLGEIPKQYVDYMMDNGILPDGTRMIPPERQDSVAEPKTTSLSATQNADAPPPEPKKEKKGFSVKGFTSSSSDKKQKK